MENSKKYRNVRKEYLDMCNSDADNTEVTEGIIICEERVSFIASTDVGEELMENSRVYNPPAYLLAVEDQINEPEHEQTVVPLQSIIRGRPVKGKNSTNWKALDRDPKTYELDKFEKNIMLIFNHFDVPGYEHRHGTHKDVEALKKTFEPLRFECTVYLDFEKSKIFDELKRITQTTNFTDIGCLAVCILTHGEANGMLWARDEMYNEIDVLNYFKGDNNKTLISKPKLLILQACRGENSTQAAKVLQRQPAFRKDHKEEAKHYYLPIKADILVVHSCALNTPAIRTMENGSWLIQAICSNVNELAAYEDLESILLEVKMAVATKVYPEHNTEGVIEFKTQMPVVTSTLTRKLNFNRAGIEVKDASNETTPLSSKILDDVTSNGSRMSAADTMCITCGCTMNFLNWMRCCVKKAST